MSSELEPKILSNLIVKLESAFERTVKPDDNSLLQPKETQILFDYEDGKKVFYGKRWQEIKVDDLYEYASFAPGCLSIYGAAYFLPAILIATIEARFDTNLMIWVDTIFFNVRQASEGIKLLLTDKQRCVVSEYISIACKYVHGPSGQCKKAIEFWRQPV